MYKYVLYIIGILLISMNTYACRSKYNPLPSQDTTSVSEIIDNYIGAVGGPALAKIKSETSTGTLLRGRTGRVPLEIIAKKPGKWVYHQKFAWGDQVTFGSDGTFAWIQDTQYIKHMDPRQRLDLQLLFDVQSPMKMREIFPELIITKFDTTGDIQVVTLLGKSREGLCTELAFDCQTGLLRRAGKIIFDDYRLIGQVRRPFKILLGESDHENHMQMEITFTDRHHDDDVEDSIFTMPNCLLPKNEPILYRIRKPVSVSTDALEACVGTYRNIENPDISYSVIRQNKHLMFRSNSQNLTMEIIPESETDYYIKFLNWDFHFIKNSAGIVTHLEFKANRLIKTEKINSVENNR